MDSSTNIGTRRKRVEKLDQGRGNYRLTLLGYLQLEVVHVHLQGFIAGGQLIDVGLDGFHSCEKG